MKNLFLIIIFIIVFTLVSGCNKNKGTYYNPDKTEKSYSLDSNISPEDTSKQNNVRLSILTSSPSNELPPELINIFQSKILELATKNNIGVIGGDPSYVLVANLYKSNEGLTSTIPTKNTVTYTVNYYIGNLITSEVLSSYNEEISGVGNSSEKASLNAIRSINDNPQIRNMLKNGTKKIVEEFEENSEIFFTRVNQFMDQGNYKAALALLNSVPSDAPEVFKRAQSIIPDISKKYNAQISKEALANMKLIASKSNEYNPEIMAYYSLIPVDSPLHNQADQIIDKYTKSFDDNIQENIKHQRYKESEELAIQKLKVRLNVEANEELLETYKVMATQTQGPTRNDNGPSSAFKSLLNTVVPIGVDLIINYFF